jgi:hypothetical protein
LRRNAGRNPLLVDRHPSHNAKPLLISASGEGSLSNSPRQCIPEILARAGFWIKELAE